MPKNGAVSTRSLLHRFCLIIITTGTLYPKDKDNLKISKVIREEINEICNYMEMHLDEKITIDYDLNLRIQLPVQRPVQS